MLTAFESIKSAHWAQCGPLALLYNVSAVLGHYRYKSILTMYTYKLLCPVASQSAGLRTVHFMLIQ
jgi:hypothetical protein